MKHLLLLRHAEAEAAAPGASDIDRSLTERGRLEAMEAAGCIARAGFAIDAILISPARRTRETAAIVTAHLNLSVPLDHEAALYLAGAQTLLRSVHGCDARTRTVLLVGHNPGISELAHQLSGGVCTDPLKTAGLCHLSVLQPEWSDLRTADASTVLR